MVDYHAQDTRSTIKFMNILDGSCLEIFIPRSSFFSVVEKFLLVKENSHLVPEIWMRHIHHRNAAERQLICDEEIENCCLEKDLF